MNVLDALARLYPRDVEPSDELSRSLAFLGHPADPESVVRAGYGVGLLGLAVTLLVWVAVRPGYPAILATAALSALAVHVVHSGPRVLALARRTRALGRTPDLVSRAVLRMRLSPSRERAAAFAAGTGDGPLATSLAGHVRRARLAGGDALSTFGAEWEEWYPALGRSLELLSAAADMDRRHRERTLDRALSVTLEGTRSQMQSFATRIRGPVTALYAFGVLLPTALVALLPAARAAGVGVTTATVVVVYDVVLPAGIVAAAVWLVARRPVAFPPPNVGRDHPDVPARGRLAVAAGLVAGAVGWVLAVAVLPPWASPVAAAGFGVGVPLWLACRPVVAVYGRVRAVEDGLTDALTLVGRRVADGVAVEAAVEDAADGLDGEMGRVLDRAVARQRRLKVGVEKAFLGDHGALSDLPSPRVRGSVAVLALAANEGQPAGPALLALADHVEELRLVERESRRDLEHVRGTLRATGAFFGPMVAGATVALADGLAGGAALPGARSLPWLGLAVGGYVLAFAVALPALATSLARGFDGPLAGHRVGRSLVVATAVYLGSYLLVAGVT